MWKSWEDFLKAAASKLVTLRDENWEPARGRRGRENTIQAGETAVQIPTEAKSRI